MKFNLMLFTMVSALISNGIHAEEQVQNVPSQQKKWGASIGIDYSRNGYEDSHYLADRNLALTATINYYLNSDTKFSAIISGRHSYDGERGEFWSDIWLTAKRYNIWNPTDNIAMSAGARILIPVSKESIKNDLNTAIRGNIKFYYSLDHIIEGLLISDSIRLRKNFHQYTTAGAHPLEEYRISNLFSVEYTPNEWFFSTNLVSSKSWSYRGKSYSPELTYTAEIGYQFNDEFSLATGLTNSATYYDPDRGPNPLENLFDLEKPTYYITLNYDF